MRLFLTSGEAGRRLGVTGERVRALARARRLRVAARTAQGVRLFTQEEVERLRSERERRSAVGREAE